MSNFVYSRRALHRLIGGLAGHLTPAQLTSLVERLNRPGDQRLPAMWELVMLDALSGVGVLRHEVSLTNGRRPDIELQFERPDGATLTILADVTTVSDAGFDAQNPVESLSEELGRLASKHGLNANHFRYDVPGDRQGPYGDARVKLSLPDRGVLLDLLRREVEPWVEGLARSGSPNDRLDYAEGGVAFALSYDTAQRYSGGGYLAYDVAASRDKNPLFRALKAKVDQLRNAPPSALRLLIACDGDCALLRQSPLMQSAGTYSAREVAWDFLRQNRTIDFVLLVTVEEEQRGSGSRRVYKTKFDLVVAPEGRRSERVTPSTIAHVDAALRQAAARVPTPVQTPYNAVHRLREAGAGPAMTGALRMSGNKITISSRALQQLLAGAIPAEQFLAAHNWAEGKGRDNPFRRMLLAGRMIASVKIEDGGDEDDDWLEFSFGSPDAAAGPIRTPRPDEADDDTDTGF